MPVNRGKDFEDVFKKCVEEVKDVAIIRLHDQTTGFYGSRNPCDFFMFKEPYLYAIECKSVHGNRLPFANITDYQWQQLTKFSEIPGVVSGVVCWFIDRDRTIFFPMQILNALKANSAKSVSFELINDVTYYTIKLEGKKKRVFYDYNMKEFFDDAEYFMSDKGFLLADLDSSRAVQDSEIQ